MGIDRKIIINDRQGTKECPDLFCNILLRDDRSGHVLSLSRKEAETIAFRLRALINKAKRREQHGDRIGRSGL